jgi:glycosyltransferase involved in cell wall biosynthesis
VRFDTVTPEITIVVPAYNCAATIKRALESVSAQSFTDYEIIVVDDGSTDETPTVVESTNIKSLKLIRHSENRGAAAARNSGIAAARGRWIAFLDSDDAWKPEKLARQIALLKGADANVRACATGYYLHKDGRELTISLKLSPRQFHREILFGCTISPGTTLLVERRVFDEIGGFDEALRRLEDWDWLLGFSERYGMAFVPEPLADVYLTTANLPSTISGTDPVLDAIRRIRMKHLPRAGSLKRKLQLQSSLLVERAATLHRRGRRAAAVLFAIAALIVYPARNAAFFRTLWHAAKRSRLCL